MAIGQKSCAMVSKPAAKGLRNVHEFVYEYAELISATKLFEVPMHDLYDVERP